MSGDGLLAVAVSGRGLVEPGEPVIAADDEGFTRGRAAFGPSPHCAADHLTVEFEIKLTATGLTLNGGYSPDPIFWGATPPKQPPVANDDEGNLEQNDSVTGPVVANDTDADGSIVPSSVVVVQPPAHGTAVSNGDG